MERSRKILIAALIGIVLVAVLALFSAQILLMLNVMVGNDIIIVLNSEEEFYNLTHGDIQNLTFHASIATNPFCSASCDYTFTDISRNKTIDNSSLDLQTIVPITRTYTINPQMGTGTLLYRFDLTCQSKKNFFCHTSEDPMSRSAVVTVNQMLNPYEVALKADLHDKLVTIVGEINQLGNNVSTLQDAISKMNATFNMSEEIGSLYIFNGELASLSSEMVYLNSIWQEQDYLTLDDSVAVMSAKMESSTKKYQLLETYLTSEINDYNNISIRLNLTRNELEELAVAPTENVSLRKSINAQIDIFNSVTHAMNPSTSITEFQPMVLVALGRLDSFYNTTSQILINESVAKEQLRRVEYKVSEGLISGFWVESPLVSGIPKYTLMYGCGGIDGINNLYDYYENSTKEQYKAQNYPSEKKFVTTISNMLSNIRASARMELGYTVNETFLPVDNYDEYNLTPALTLELMNTRLPACQLVADSNKSINEVIEPVILVLSNKTSFNMSFDEPQPICCVRNDCSPCCTGSGCSTENYPVIFLHGHAIYQGTSAELSFDTFTQIEKKLGEFGYVDAGIITPYTQRDTPQGILGQFNASVTFRGSYYFDVLQSENGPSVTQTKSENIDAYAVRIKSLVEIAKYMTGKDKVNIVAYSMGGLVARRYVQMFGDSDVNKLITLGTPNHGIEGRIAFFCPVIGNELECNDMLQNSAFMRTLNNGTNPKIPVFAIYAEGCPMGNTTGDGVVTVDSSRLNFATNFVINGTCRSDTDPLHLDLIDTSRYPQSYEYIEQALAS